MFKIGAGTDLGQRGRNLGVSRVLFDGVLELTPSVYIFAFASQLTRLISLLYFQNLKFSKHLL